VPDKMAQYGPGYVLAFDAVTGKQKWAFSHRPRKRRRIRRGRPGEGGSNEYTGKYRRGWAPISVDSRTRAYALSAGRNPPTNRLFTAAIAWAATFFGQFGRSCAVDVENRQNASGTIRSTHHDVVELRPLISADAGRHDGPDGPGACKGARGSFPSRSYAYVARTASPASRSGRFEERPGAGKRCAGRAHLADAAASDQAAGPYEPQGL